MTTKKYSFDNTKVQIFYCPALNYLLLLYPKGHNEISIGSYWTRGSIRGRWPQKTVAMEFIGYV